MSEIGVLVVDDEAAVRLNLAAYLEDEGFAVRTAESGELGLEMLADFVPAVAIVDMRMQGMEGNTFIARAHRRSPMLRFVVFTGSAEYQRPVEVRDAGVGEEDIYIKPVRDMAVLAAAVRRLAADRDSQGSQS